MFNSTPIQDLCAPMQILAKEHAVLRKQMTEWHKVALRFENELSEEEAAASLMLLSELVKPFDEALAVHAKKEEDHFFPMLGRYIGYEQGPLVMMEYEHEMAEKLLSEFLQETASGIEGRTLVEMKRLAQKAAEAFEVLSVHFMKEENVLFPMTARVMSPKDQETLLSLIAPANIG